MEKHQHGARVLAPSSRRRTLTLSPVDVERLSQFRWRYLLEGWGFTTKEADRLLFARWLFLRGALHD